MLRQCAEGWEVVLKGVPKRMTGLMTHFRSPIQVVS